MKLIKTLLPVFFVTLQLSVNSQNNLLYNQDVEYFLDRCDVLGLININHHQKPYSRQEIFKFLKTIEIQKEKLSDVMKNELDFYINEYNTESKEEYLTFMGKNENNAYRFLEIKENDFAVTVYPDIGVGLSGRNDKYDKKYYNGFSFYGNIEKIISFDFDYNDISIKKNPGNPELMITEDQGWDYVKYFSSTKTNNYDRTKGNLTLNFDKISIGLSKENIYWGTGYSDKIILSDKAPSFPHLSLRIKPTHWIEFRYFYGSLNSMFYDSTSIRNQDGLRYHINLIEKYIAAHLVTLDITENLKLSLGESVIISDKFEPIYLIPILFFRIADHYLSKSDYNSGNAQLFGALSYRIPKAKLRFDFSIFIDEMNITRKESPNAIAFSTGTTIYDLLLSNTGLQIEYVRIDPFVYTHADPLQWYSNRNYNLGHWLGNNTDMIFLKLSYKPIPLLNFTCSYQYNRRGKIERFNEQRYQSDQKFLYGERSYFSSFSFTVDYQMINNLYLNFSGGIKNSWGKNNLLNVSDYKFNFLTLGLNYGFE